jgi:hypothetical protein
MKFEETIDYLMGRVRANPQPINALQLSQAVASLANAKATLETGQQTKRGPGRPPKSEDRAIA